MRHNHIQLVYVAYRSLEEQLSVDNYFTVLLHRICRDTTFRTVPHEEQQRAVLPLNGPMTGQQYEESPDVSNIESADSVTLLRNLGSKIYQESNTRTNCVIAASGILLTFGIYHLLRIQDRMA
ncbi:hypothetical protein OS493_016340 [Desmophyllum pertusum]|uniref:Uncharacterized protein n=1 Tax=Desmophyllum pertusum TaxID=174260 RepID=A0A9W9ZSQ5_9CNID|nr:hypothetical protein OS493_016340 [Desmophyllum pertusum]